MGNVLNRMCDDREKQRQRTHKTIILVDIESKFSEIMWMAKVAYLNLNLCFCGSGY